MALVFATKLAMSISDHKPRESIDSVSTFESVELLPNKIAHVHYANQNNLPFLDRSSNSIQTFQAPLEYGHFNYNEPYGYGQSKLPQHLSNNYSSRLNNQNDKLTLSAFGSLSSEDSSLTSSPSSTYLHQELSELGLSLSKLALHAEGAPIIVCDEGTKKNSPFPSTITNGSPQNNRTTRRKSYRLLHTLPLPGINFPEDAFSCFSTTSLSTAYHRYQQNVAYFYQHNPSLFHATIGPGDIYPIHNSQSQFSGQFMLHHHFHYHHHLHQHSNLQLKDWNETVDKSGNMQSMNKTNSTTIPLSSECQCATCSRSNNLSHHDFGGINLLKGDDLVYQTNHNFDSRHFKPIGNEGIPECAYQENANLLESLNRPKAPTHCQSLFGDMIDETSSLDSIDDASDSIYSSISSLSCSSSSVSMSKFESNGMLTNDFCYDFNDDLSNKQQPYIIHSSTIKSSPLCSLTLSSLDESSISSLPSSPSSCTSNSSLIFSSEFHPPDSLPNMLSEDRINNGNANKGLKLPRPIKARKRKKKDKPIPVIRRVPSNLTTNNCSLVTNHRASLDETFKFSSIKRKYFNLFFFFR